MDYKDIKLIVIKTDSTWIERIPYNHFDDELRIGENFMYNKRTIYKFDDEVLEYGEVEKIYLNFSDPWPVNLRCEAVRMWTIRRCPMRK